MNQSSSKSIIAVDDTPENLRLLGRILNDQGYRVRLCPDGERALASVQQEKPDLILLDAIMPDMDGYEVCRCLKADGRLSDVPVIFISALNESIDKVEAFAVGALDFITKPFQVGEVLARVKMHLSLEEMRQRLDAQNQELQEQNRELEAFAHTVAHDLKNPLSIMLSALQLIHEDPEIGLASDQTRTLLSMSLQNVNTMNSIIDELLLLASIRKEDVQIAPVEMDRIVERAFQRIANLVDRYQPLISLPEQWPNAYGYAPWIEEVWVNYLSNGLKYGGEPPALALEATPQPDGRIRFSVRDNGQGLDATSQLKLFSEFSRLDAIRAEGHGLGLSIVRRIMAKLDGQFGVESAPGQGSLFYFTLAASL